MPSRRSILHGLAAAAASTAVPLTANRAVARAAASASPWRALFNGRDLDDWRDRKSVV